MNTKGFQITEGRGYKMTLDNGVTISVQFGPSNYCDHYNTDFGNDPRKTSYEAGDAGSSTAEVAAWYEDGTWIPLRMWDDVLGYQTASDVAALIGKLSKLPRDGYVQLKETKKLLKRLEESNPLEDLEGPASAMIAWEGRIKEAAELIRRLLIPV